MATLEKLWLKWSYWDLLGIMGQRTKTEFISRAALNCFNHKSVEGSPGHCLLQNHRDLSLELTHSLGGLQRNGCIVISTDIILSV